MSKAPFALDVNLSVLFTELPLLARPSAAAAAGFDAAELWWPFDQPAPSEREARNLLESLGEAGLQLVAVNFDAGDMAQGDRGLFSLRHEQARLRDNIDATVDFAVRAGCRLLNALYGNRLPGTAPALQDDVALENLIYAATAARKVDASILIEALNSSENPAYPLTSASAALDVVSRLAGVGLSNVGFLADLYHLGRMGEPLDQALALAGERLFHVQIADPPLRHQPGTGKFGVPGLFGPLDAIGYRGWVGLEYRPSGPSATSFAWLSELAQYDGAGEASRGTAEAVQ